MPDDVLEMIGTAALLEQLAEESAERTATRRKALGGEQP